MGGKVYLRRDVKKKSTSYFSYFLWAAIGLLCLVVITPLLTKRGGERRIAERVTPEKGMVMKGIPRSVPYDSPAEEPQEGVKTAQEIKESNVETASATSKTLPASDAAKSAPVPAPAQNPSMMATGTVPGKSLPEPGVTAAAKPVPGQMQTSPSAIPQPQQEPTPPSAGNMQAQQSLPTAVDAAAAPPTSTEPTSPKPSPTMQASASAKPKLATPPAKPPAAASPASTTTSAASPSGPTKYVVQIGSFSQRENADSIQQQLLKKGYEVMVRTITHEKFGRLYIVQLAPVYDANKAQSLVSKVKQEANVQPMVIKLPTD